MKRDRAEVHNHAKKDEASARSIEDFLQGIAQVFLEGNGAYSLSGRDGAILPGRVANHSAGFGSPY